jgi:hypothetical protein
MILLIPRIYSRHTPSLRAFPGEGHFLRPFSLAIARQIKVTILSPLDALIDEARRVGHHATKKEGVRAALEEYVQRRKQLEILNLFGTIDYDPDFDHQTLRRLNRC